MKKEKLMTFANIMFVVGLLMLVSPTWGQAPSTGSTMVGTKGVFFNVLDYGALNDGTEFGSDGINAAIQAADSKGGGTVYIPAGEYICKPIKLVSNLILYIDAGAVLRFPAQNVPFSKGRNQDIECIGPVPLIGGDDLHNVSVLGKGIITTNNAEWMKLKPRDVKSSAAGPNWAKLLQSLEVKTPATEEEYLAAAPELRPPFLRVMNCKNVHIEGIRIVGSSQWSVYALYSENVVIHGITVETYPGVHTGGIYMSSSSYVRISDCFIETGDDGIVIDAGKDADGLRVNRPCENLAITNCTIRRAHGAVTLGSATAGGFRNIVASNITCEGTKRGIRIKSRRGRGGFIENVRFDNWTMNNVGTAINVTNYYKMEGEVFEGDTTVVTNRTPQFKNIAISNMTVNNAKIVMNVEGLPEMPIKGLRVTDLIGSGERGFIVSRSDDLELSNIRVNVEKGPAFMISNSTELLLDNVATSAPLANTPVIQIESSPGAIVRNSKAYPNTDVFVSTKPGQLKDIIMLGNITNNAKKVTEEK